MKTVEQKDVAIQCLEKLDVYKPYIRKFNSEAGIPCFFEGFAGFYVDQEPEIYNKMKEVEVKFGCLVYALTHEISNIGETWTMLCVPKDNDGVDDVIGRFSNNEFYAFAYVWNKSDDWCSEFGDVVVKSFGGGIKRIH